MCLLPALGAGGPSFESCCHDERYPNWRIMRGTSVILNIALVAQPTQAVIKTEAQLHLVKSKFLPSFVVRELLPCTLKAFYRKTEN